jgi:menaquinone-specific isochorismate synthase
MEMQSLRLPYCFSYWIQVTSEYSCSRIREQLEQYRIDGATHYGKKAEIRMSFIGQEVPRKSQRPHDEGPSSSGIETCVHKAHNKPFNTIFEGLKARLGVGFQWYDRQRDLQFSSWGNCDQLTLSTTQDSDDRSLHLNASRASQELFTHLRTIIPVQLQGLPIGYFANRFDPQRRVDSESPWSLWPALIFCVPHIVIVQKGSGPVHEFNFGSSSVESPKDATVITGDHDEANTPPSWRCGESKIDWSRRVDSVERACIDGRVSKVVLAHCSERVMAKSEHLDLSATMKRLKAHHPDSIVFCLPHGDSAFIGATPEILAELDGGSLRTHALAGTMAVGGSTSAEAMLEDEKLVREHACVVEALVDDLRIFCSEVEVAAMPAIRHLRTMAHLQTPIHARVTSRISILDVAERLHPTPALAGAPRKKAMDWLRASEPLDRGYYGGPIGLFDARSEGICAVAIRSGVLSPNRASAFAGAGIVQGSIAAEEWNETMLKMDTFQSCVVSYTQVGKDLQTHG